MTDAQIPAADRPAAGYYPDPAGGPRRRWWDGYAWTDQLEQDAAYVAVGADGRPVQPPLPSDAKVNTVWGWLFAVSPALSILTLPMMDLGGMMTRSFENPENPLAMYTPGYFAAAGLGWLLFGLSVVAAYLDHRTLRRMGVVRPFHWAWSFLWQVPYAIGRGVVLRRRVGRGIAPTWLYVALYALGVLLSFVVVIQVTIATFEAINTIGFS